MKKNDSDTIIDRSLEDVSQLPVMKRHCKTCPFRPNENGLWCNPELANEVIARTLFKASQICHGTEGKNREPNHKCKGAYDHNMVIYRRLNMVPSGFKDP